MHRPTRPPLLLALALACTPGEQTSATAKATHASDATDSGSTTSTSTSPTSSTTPTTAAMTTVDSTGACSSHTCTDMGPPTCDPYAQDCPVGQKCTGVATHGGDWPDADICVPLDPNPVPPGAPCTSEGLSTGVDSCDKGAACWFIDPDTGVGTCLSFCIDSLGSHTCADPTQLCVITAISTFDLCVPKCDPLDPGTCPGELCLPNPEGEAGFVCILDASDGKGVVNTSCGFANACNPGLLCVNPALGPMCDQNATGCCQPYCDLTKPPEDYCDAKGGQLCLPLFDIGMAPPGYENIGVCGIPQ